MPTPRGSFYAFADVAVGARHGATSGSLVEDWLAHGVAVLPGTAFGPEHARLGAHVAGHAARGRGRRRAALARHYATARPAERAPSDGDSCPECGTEYEPAVGGVSALPGRAHARSAGRSRRARGRASGSRRGGGRLAVRRARAPRASHTVLRTRDASRVTGACGATGRPAPGARSWSRARMPPRRAASSPIISQALERGGQVRDEDVEGQSRDDLVNGPVW